MACGHKEGVWVLLAAHDLASLSDEELRELCAAA